MKKEKKSSPLTKKDIVRLFETILKLIIAFVDNF